MVRTCPDRSLVLELLRGSIVAVGAAWLSLGVPVSGQGPAPGSGSWSPLYDWSPQLSFIYTTIPPPPPHQNHYCEAGPISHAALIPTGMHRGKVLLWNAELYRYCPDPEGTPPCSQSVGGTCGPTQKTWLFDPGSATQLIEIREDPDPLVTNFLTNIFCSGTSWDGDGNLMVVGGEDTVQFTGSTAAPGSYPAAFYRFHPGFLTSSVPASPPTVPHPYILASPWAKFGDMSIPRNYGNIVPLNKAGFVSNCGTGLPHFGGGSLVIGGRPEYTQGNEVWDFLNAGELTWSCAFVPSLPVLPYPHTFYDHTDSMAMPPTMPLVTHPTTFYDPKTQAGPDDYPELDLESYPKAHQLSTGEIVIAGDRDKINPAINTPALTWVIRPHYSNDGGQTRWQLWRSTPAVADRQWGTAVLLHMKDSAAALDHNDRLFAIGGGTAIPTPTTLDTIEEFKLGSSDPLDDAWDPKTSMNHARWQLNAVTLPTGHLFLHGGDGPHALGGLPVHTPEVYDPGRTPTSPTSSVDVAQHPAQIPRGQHHVALLLPDARVFIAGGDWKNDDNPVPPDSRHNGAIYSPWYLEHTFRPQILRSASSATFNPPGASSNKFELKVLVGIQNSIERVVLIRPGAVTHHFDNDQRYIELASSIVSTSVPNSVSPAPPPTIKHLVLEVTCPSEVLGPPGWYMLFAVEKRASDNALAPSVAAFIDLQ
jgi:Domain of unknown function (DUF1929)